MSELLPRGEKLRRALGWISDRRREQPARRLGALVGDAALRFDLSPREAEVLLGFLRGAGGERPPEER